MIQAELRRLHSPDILDLEHYRPKKLTNFAVLVQAMVGPKGMPGEESFDFIVCTPHWLNIRLKEEEYILGHRYIIVQEYIYNRIYKAIKSLCERAKGDSWSDVAVYIGKYGGWEFDEYRPFS